MERLLYVSGDAQRLVASTVLRTLKSVCTREHLNFLMFVFLLFHPAEDLTVLMTFALRE